MIKFYQRNKSDIKQLVSDLLNDCGFKSTKDVFGYKWDIEDIDISETNNQNLLAWFGFEHVCTDIYNSIT